MRTLPVLVGSLVLPLAAQAAPAVTTASLDAYIRSSMPACVSGPSTTCYEGWFRFADTDGDGRLSRAEVQALHAALRDWALTHGQQLAPADRQGLAAGLLVVQVAGLDNLFDSYDLDHDGKLTRSELSADVHLDQRPVPVLMRDPKAVDWNRLSDRLGPASIFIREMIPRQN